MNCKALLISSAAIGAALFALPAQAIPLQFELTGSRQASFVLDSMPTPDRANSSFSGDQIFFEDVSGTFAGVPGTARVISFGTGVIAKLNIQAPGLGFTQFAGPELFSGGASAPMFSTGVFNLTSLVSGASTLTITEAGPGQQIPEPAMFGLLLGGLGLMAFARRKQTLSVSDAK